MPSSGLGGPCDHCGRTQSCCWRRGPALKPVLCNACGSRYLVKKSLDGYVPVQQRQGSSRGGSKFNNSKTKPHPNGRASGSNSARNASRRNGPKRANESLVWSSEPYDTSIDEVDDSCLTNTSAAAVLINHFQDEKPVLPRLPDSPIVRQRRRRSSLKDSNKILRITSDAQLHSLCPKDVSRLITPSLRLKPRKPLNPRISVVF